MKNCPACQKEMADDAVFCPHCGYSYANGAAPVQTVYVPVPDPADHTAEFTAKDISDNKVIAMLVYLLGAIGIIVALLVGKESPFVAFHLRQSLKFVVVEALLAICTALLFWTFIVPIAAGICYCILFVLKIIAFFQICGGKAKEPAIIRSLAFLK